MPARIQPDLIALEAAQRHDLKLDPKRASELAADVQRVCDAATGSAGKLTSMMSPPASRRCSRASPSKARE